MTLKKPWYFFAMNEINLETCYTRRKKYSREPFLVLQLVTNIDDSCQYLEGPSSTWKDHVRVCVC